VQDVFITEIHLDGKTLFVTNESSERFEMDLASGKLRALTRSDQGGNCPSAQRSADASDPPLRTVATASRTVPQELRTLPLPMWTPATDFRAVALELWTVASHFRAVRLEVRTPSQSIRTVVTAFRTVPEEIRTIAERERTVTESG
jgi:hypothetical protein